MAIEDWSPTAANNSTVLGVNIAENCPAANVNNALRQLMADVAGGINFDILGDFLASTSLSSARSALGVSGGSTSASNFGNLTNQANKVPYMQGGDAWATTDLTSYARTLIAAGDASTARTILGISGSSSSVNGSASSGWIAIGNLKLQWKDATAAGGTSTTVTFPTAFTSWSRAWVNPRSGATDAELNNPVVSSDGTTSCTVTSSRDSSISCTIFAIGV
jgi:hypothetical protein